MSLMESIQQKAKAQKKRILLPEGTEERTVQAVAKIKAEGIAEVTLLGKTDEIQAVAGKFNVSLDGVSLVDPEKDADFREYVNTFYEMRKEKGVTPEKAEAMMKSKEITNRQTNPSCLRNLISVPPPAVNVRRQMPRPPTGPAYPKPRRR